MNSLQNVWNRTRLFDSNTEGRRRSVLFSMAVLAGFMAVAATSAMIVSTPHLPSLVTLTLLGSGAFVFAMSVYGGQFDHLVEDDEILWQLFGDAR